MNRSLSRILATCAATLALSAAGTAHAGVYELSFIGDNVSGDVFATTTGAGPSQTVVGITGWVTDSEISASTFNITGLSGYAAADNLFYLASPFVDFGGLSFSTSGGAFNLGLGGSNATGLVFNAEALNAGGYPGGVGSTNIVMTAAAIPEPANLVLLLAGLGMVGVMASRRRSH